MLRDKAAPQSDALKVGIAVDGSKYGRAAVRYALKHISLFGTGAQFYLINVVSDYAGAVMPDMAGMALPALSEEEVLELQKDEFNEAVEPLRPLFAKAAVATKEICLVGNAGDEIAAFAKRRSLTSWSWAPTATVASKPPSWGRPPLASPRRATFRS